MSANICVCTPGIFYVVCTSIAAQVVYYVRRLSELTVGIAASFISFTPLLFAIQRASDVDACEVILSQVITVVCRF